MFPVPSVERPKGDRIGGGVYTEIPGTGDWNSSSNAISDMLSPVFESQDDFRSVGGYWYGFLIKGRRKICVRGILCQGRF